MRESSTPTTLSFPPKGLRCDHAVHTLVEPGVRFGGT
jgi:hypothetical protein